MSEIKVIVSKRAWKLARAVARALRANGKRVYLLAVNGDQRWVSETSWYDFMSFSDDPVKWPSARDRATQESPWGRWQSDLSIIDRVFDDDRDLPLQGQRALTWRAPHQWPVKGRKVGVVFQEGSTITLVLRPKVWKEAGVGKEVIADYARWATGNY